MYAATATRLTEAELGVLNSTVFAGRLSDIGQASIGGVTYVTFAVADGSELTASEVAFLGNLSSGYALFRVVDGQLLAPVQLSRLDRYDDDLITIQKYQGKTNEHFTKLMLNVAVWSSAFGPRMLERRLRVMDPMCGRGTTLNQAVMYGFDAAGLDHDKKDFDTYTAFLKTWLRRKRLKHQVDTGPVRAHGKVVGHRTHAEFAASREEYKAGDVQQLTVVAADTTRALDFYRQGEFDVVVADAPYGIQHGSRSDRQGLRRDPGELLSAAVPVWARLLRRGGAMAISWNTYVAKRADLVTILDRAGLEVCGDVPYGQFEHWVDQAITRDLVVARKPD
ncbi:TRM11 family SAM-dependent methyltransferase [Lipingzhangella rawalii]|uniref:TRM11 family SAM-dependent methyltransferase n=1 Tax=Lipingzhangella rawalii TaxID=2055835 RepID=UPI00287B6886|nr:SAM-dependent methyltransferase [Lipingzhangella rawalii]